MADLGLHLSGKSAVGGEVRAADGHFDRRWRTEIHDLAHDVARLKGELTIGEDRGQPLSQARLKLAKSDRAGSKGSEKHSLVRPAGPKKNRVDGIGGRLNANVSQGHHDIV